MFSDYKNYEMKITDNNITLTIYNQLQFSTLRTLEFSSFQNVEYFFTKTISHRLHRLTQIKL